MQDRLKKTFALCLLAGVVATAPGCHRGDEIDDRTLAQKPSVETVAPDDRKNIFRP